VEDQVEAEQQPDTQPAHGAGLRGVITDWGGVLTNPISETVNAWLEADGIDRGSYRTLMRSWVTQAYTKGAANPIHRLERGDGDPADFERALAAQLVALDGSQVQATGLLDRMFAGTQAVPEMYELMRALRRAGIKTCLLSNSWGKNDYPVEVFPELFDAWVISAEVRMRKPEAEIFLHAARLLQLPPESCVFIDDIEANIEAANALGMAGVLHTDALSTTAKLAGLLGLPLGGPRPS
jgi:putative hydrolase of the HAD superfamily